MDVQLKQTWGRIQERLNKLVAMVQRGCMEGFHGTETKLFSYSEVKRLGIIYIDSSSKLLQEMGKAVCKCIIIVVVVVIYLNDLSAKLWMV